MPDPYDKILVFWPKTLNYEVRSAGGRASVDQWTSTIDKSFAMTRLVWFRSDLRVTDNPALTQACTDSGDVIACVGFPETQWDEHHMGPRWRQLTRTRCAELASELAALRIPLLRLNGDDYHEQVHGILSLCREHRVHSLHFNVEYGWNEQQRDQQIQQHCEDANIRVHASHDQTLVVPGQLKTGAGGFYSVFTPFRRRWSAQLSEEGISLLPVPKARPALAVAPDQWSKSADSLWPMDSTSIETRIDQAIEGVIKHYADRRDRPGIQGTSQLSPYLANGSISPRYLVHRVLMEHPQGLDMSLKDDGAVTFLSEIAWRDFYKNLMVEVPRISRDMPFKLETEGLRWSTDQTHFERWCRGNTGIPIVDAAMRQLLATGWMHNRCRMIVAMFLTKNLWINWRWGERFFAQHLVDYDLPPTTADGNGLPLREPTRRPTFGL